MKRLVFICLCLGLLPNVFAQTIFTDVKDGEIFWRCKIGTNALLPDSILQTYGIKEIKSPFQVLNPKKLKGEFAIAQLHRTYRIRFSEYAEIDKLMAWLSAQPYTELVEKVPLVQTFYTPNDPQFSSQWNLAKIDATNAWNLSLGNSLVRVAVVDDAVLKSHQDLQGNIWTNPAEIPGNALDDDGNGYVDDTQGWDAADNDNNAEPPLAFATNSVFTHGTHCAGIVSARMDNNTGIAAIGANVKIIPVKCNNDATPGPSLPNAYDGVIYALTLTPEVMSLSWGGPLYSATNQLLFDVAYANDIVVCAAAGNSNVNTPMYPASYNHVISVAATNDLDLKASFSNFGTTIDVSAPGVDILSTLAGSTSSYGLLSGTSMATPLVAGLCGLMRSFNPAKNVDEIENCLKSTADDIYPLNAAYIGQLGAGRINAFHALQCVSGPPIAQIGVDYTDICPGTVVQFSDNSYGTPTSWSWTFPGGTPATSTLQNPTVTYNTPGVYSVTLTVTNALGSDSETFNSITVQVPSATISGTSIINIGDPAFLTVSFTGSGPWDFVYTDGTTNFPVNGVTLNPYSFTVTPSVTTNYTLVSMNSVHCAGAVLGNANVVVSNGCGAPFNFQQLFGGTLMDNPNAIRQTPDCGYIIGGNTYSYGTGNGDAFLAKLNPDGSVAWFKTYGDAADNSYFLDVISVSNGYIAVGSRGANNQTRSVVMKTDLNGVFQWERDVEFVSGGGMVIAGWNEVIELQNGNLIVGGAASGANFNSTGQILAEIDGTNGNVNWVKDVQQNDFEYGRGFIRTNGGNYVMAGYSRSTPTNGLFDINLTKYNSIGNVLWSKQYGANFNEFGQDVLKLSDQSMIVVGYTEGFTSSVSDMTVMRVDSNGVVKWAKLLGRSAADQAKKVVKACNDKFYVVGSSRGVGTGNDLAVMLMDSLGNVLWSKAVGGVLEEGDYVGAAATGDCGCAFTTNTLTYGSGENDVLIAKTDTLGFFSCHATNISLTQANFSPTVLNASPTNTNNSSQPVYPNTEQVHTPTIPADVCDACGTPVADFSYVTNVLSLACIDNSVNGETWGWDFGDGTAVDTMRNAVHAYAAAGVYTVMQVVYSPCGSDTLIKQITITGTNECKHVMQPGPVNGVDASVGSRDDIQNWNGGSAVQENMMTWTWNGYQGTLRSYLWYDLSKICNTATLLNADFSAWHNSIWGQPHSGANQAWLQRVTSNWDEYSITWLTQPTTTATNQIAIPAQSGTTNLTVNVTPLLQDLITGPNNGFLWRHQVEQTYVRTLYASSDWVTPAERPMLELTFEPIYAYAEVPSTGTQSVTICPNDSIQLFAAGYLNGGTTAGPSVATAYLWIPSNGLSCDDCPNPKASPDSTTTYRVITYNCPSCADIDTIRVEVSRVFVEAQDTILCSGDTITLNAFHPGSSVTYVWTPTTTLSPPNVQDPNVYPTTPTWYYVEATDNILGCVSKDSALVTVGYPPILPNLIGDTVICAGTVLPGTFISFPLTHPFTPIGSDYYTWSPSANILPTIHDGAASANIDLSLQGVSYNFVLVVENEYGCVNRDSVQVQVNNCPVTTSQQNISCFGGNDGEITITPLAGQYPFTYDWGIPNQTDSSATGLSAGTYNITITDANGVVNVVTVILTQPSLLTLQATQTSTILCNGGQATVSLTGSGGTPAYVGTGVQNVYAGENYFFITDANGCIARDTLTILQPDSLIVQADILTLCAGNAVIQVSASGGTPNYVGLGTFNVGVGTHYFPVTDANGCASMDSVIIQATNPLVATATPDSIRCHGQSTRVLIAATGGTPPYVGTGYQYNFFPGTYNFTVSDAQGCVTYTSTTITEPPLLSATIQSSHPYCDSANGTASVSVSGGTPPYTYSWNTNPSQSNDSINQLFAGQYLVWVVDDKGCTLTRSVNLVNTPPAYAAFSSMPNNDSAIFESEMPIHFLNESTHAGPAYYLWNFGDGNTSGLTNPVYSFTQPGTYQVILMADNGFNFCPTFDTMTYIIIPNGALYIPNAITPNGDGHNDFFILKGEGIQQVECLLFDRWGIEIYRMTSMSDSWNAMYKNEDVPEGVYTWRVSATFNDGRKLNRAGTVTVIR